MSQATQLANGEVQDLVYSWFRKITDKAPLDQMLALLSPDELEIRFPDATLRNHDEFRRWYETVTNLYFDQVHDLKLLAIDLDGDRASVNLIVNWQARTWKAPAATSKWEGYYVHQAWTVKRNPASGRAVIVSYQVGEFDPMPGH